MSKNEATPKIALVTGASRGLGYSVAKALAAQGSQIVAVARTVGGLEELDDAICSAGGLKPVLVPLDITDGDGVDRLGAALFERFGKVDLWVHCAAQGAPLSPAAHVKPKDLQKLWAVNTAATQRLIASIDPLLRQSQNGQALICVDEKAGGQYWGAYGATKAAAAAIAESYAAETPGVQVHLYAPPALPTAVRARTHPGEDRSALTPTDVGAQEIVALLS